MLFILITLHQQQRKILFLLSLLALLHRPSHSFQFLSTPLEPHRRSASANLVSCHAENEPSACTGMSKNSSNDHDIDSINVPRADSNQRRLYIQRALAMISTSIPVLFLNPGDITKGSWPWPGGTAQAAQTTGEAIRRSAANLPGYGQADVFYPPSFLGKWKATRVIVSSDDPIFTTTMLSSLLPLTISYDVRFITVDGDEGVGVGSGAVDKVIADRQFNEDSYYSALRAAIVERMNARQQESSGDNLSRTSTATAAPPPFVQAISWSPSNPNVLTSNYNDGSSKEVKVTKRSTELDTVNGIISSSEYRRITTVASGTTMGVPSISASRVLNKWKINENGVVEGIEIVYSDGILGDPMAAAAGGAKQQQQLSSKCRLRLERG